MHQAGFKPQWKQSVPRDLFITVGQRLQDQNLIAIGQSDIYWDTVKSISYVGEREVYDIGVPGAYNFLANDIIVHNSTYARCGLLVNLTPAEQAWRGRLTLELANLSPLPIRLYVGQGIAQIVFFRGDRPERVYSEKKAGGAYQNQEGAWLPR